MNDSVRDHVWPTTSCRNEAIVRLHLKPRLGLLKLPALSPAHVQAPYRAKLDGGLSSITVHRIHEVLDRALKRAARWKMVARSVCEAVAVLRRGRPDIRPLNAERARAFLTAGRGNRYEAFFVLTLTAGLRLGDLQGLCWDAVDLNGGQLQVRRTPVRAGAGLIFRKPKTARGRVVALTPRAALRSTETISGPPGNTKMPGWSFVAREP